MGIMSRIGNLFKAKANKAVTAAEKADPVAILEMNIQKAKENIKKFETCVQQFGAQQKKIEQSISENKKNVEKYIADAKYASNAGNKELALKMAEKKVSCDNEIESLKNSLKTAKTNFETSKKNLFSSQENLKNKEKELKLYKTKFESAKAQKDIRETMGKLDLDDGLSQMDDFKDTVDMMENENNVAMEMAYEADTDAQMAELRKKSSAEDALNDILNK